MDITPQIYATNTAIFNALTELIRKCGTNVILMIPIMFFLLNRVMSLFDAIRHKTK